MEIPAPMSGVVKSISVNLGDQVSTGSDILTLEVEGEGSGDDKADSDKDKDGAEEKSASTGSGKADEKKSAEEKPAAKSEEKPSGSTATSERDVEVPDLGTDDEVEVIEVHVKDGDEIAAEDSLITLESDKAAMEVPAPEAGKVKGMQIKVGDKVKTGAKILVLEVASSSGSSTEDSKAVEEKPAAKEETAAKTEEAPKQAAPEPASQASTESSGRVYAGPAVRKLARELGVDLTQVQGSGAKSRITKEDLHEFVKSRINAAPAVSSAPGLPAIEDIDFSKFGEIEEVQRSKLEKVTAVNMHRNWMSVPHVAQFNEADVTDLEDFRAELKSEAEKRGTRLTFLPFLLKACARTLQEYPQFNVSLHSSGEKLIQKKYYHIGVAVATPAGLVVPVIRDVDKKSIWELSEEVLEISDKAKQRKLSREDMQGACFTISSLGAIGGTGFIPIINAPEVAILGVAKTTVKPVYMDGEFKPRKMLPLTLSYDHRAVNGVDGGMFADYLVRALGDIRRLIL
jgi:pyruvate dehydrogenase E2 component (dihydrolipoamide acetyltransferase)